MRGSRRRRDGRFAADPPAPERRRVEPGAVFVRRWRGGVAFRQQLGQGVARPGVRPIMRLASMPTATTSQILGNTEAFEPVTSNIYVRRTLAGEFVCISRHLLRDLIDAGLWTPTLKNK
ncbi:hypothetical protein B4Q13_22895, partial [Lacticaseibacillus rhamnosus]